MDMIYTCNRCKLVIDEIFIDRFETLRDEKVVCLSCAKRSETERKMVMDIMFNKALDRSRIDETIQS